MLGQIFNSPIFKILLFLIWLGLGLWALFKGELYIRHIKEPIKGAPARVVGFFTCLGVIAIAFAESGIVSGTYYDVAFYTFAISLLIVGIMVFLLGLIIWFKR